MEESRAPYRPGASFNLCFTKVVEGSVGRERVRGLIKGRCFISAMSGDKRGRKKNPIRDKFGDSNWLLRRAEEIRSDINRGNG